MKPIDYVGFKWIGLATNLNWPGAVFFASIRIIDSLLPRWRRNGMRSCEHSRKPKQNYERQCQADQFKMSAAQREQVLALSTDFPRLWNDSGTPIANVSE